MSQEQVLFLSLPGFNLWCFSVVKETIGANQVHGQLESLHLQGVIGPITVTTELFAKNENCLLGSAHNTLLLLQHHFNTPIESSSLLRFVISYRPEVAVTFCFQPAGIDPVLNEPSCHRLSSPQRKF